MPEPEFLWAPSATVIQESNLAHYLSWLRSKGKTFESYAQLHQWSVQNVEAFWQSQMEYFHVSYTGNFGRVLDGQMPTTQWFKGVEVSYAEHVFRMASALRPALIFKDETGKTETWSWQQLQEKVSGLQQFLREAGVAKGDRVVAYLPNIPEATAAFLAANSLGAIWSSCSPDFGAQAVLDRFVQIEPKVLIAVQGYHYGGKYFSREAEVKQLVQALPSLEQVVLVGGQQAEMSVPITLWNAIAPSSTPIQFTRVDFSHPIWVLYSSGTTGKPKAITHGTGGILLEQLKYGAFHQDIKPGERCFWYTTTGWMMWNYLTGCLLAGATLVLYDGHPAWPNASVLWRLIDAFEISHFGISGSYVVAMMKAGVIPKEELQLNSLRSIGSTGSPLPTDGFKWIYENVKQDVWLTSMSGGTDVCSAFVGGCPLLPVYASEIQCIALGCDLHVWDDTGHPASEEGEMVIRQPMPSMPVFFWGDVEGQRYTESYFDMFPGVWRHGDWIRKTRHGGIIIYGRSDATLNRGGVRIGSAEIYKVLDRIPEIKDSLIVCIDKPDGEFYMPLFVQLHAGATLTDTLRATIKQQLKAECSPRHIPDAVIACPDIPYTISGKKSEVPVKKLLMGQPLSKVANAGALRNPESLAFFVGQRE